MEMGRFFDFSNVNTVTATLNSQGRTIVATTYKYVRLEFCKYEPVTANIKWSGGGESGEFAQPSCNTTREISPPITVNDGESVTINLSYSLANSISLAPVHQLKIATITYVFNYLRLHHQQLNNRPPSLVAAEERENEMIIRGGGLRHHSTSSRFQN